MPKLQKTKEAQLFELLLDVVNKSTLQLAAVTRALGEIRNNFDERINAHDNTVAKVIMELENLADNIKANNTKLEELRKAILECPAMKDVKWWQDVKWLMAFIIVLLIIMLSFAMQWDLIGAIKHIFK